MATLIPALGTCVARMTSGKRRWAERLQEKLEDDYLGSNILPQLTGGQADDGSCWRKD